MFVMVKLTAAKCHVPIARDNNGSVYLGRRVRVLRVVQFGGVRFKRGHCLLPLRNEQRGQVASRGARLLGRVRALERGRQGGVRGGDGGLRGGGGGHVGLWGSIEEGERGDGAE